MIDKEDFVYVHQINESGIDDKNIISIETVDRRTGIIYRVWYRK